MMHGHGKMGAAPASDAALVPRLSFFFLQVRANSAPICANSASIHDDLARIGSYWPVAETDQNGQNRPKLALNHAGIAEIGFE